LAPRVRRDGRRRPAPCPLLAATAVADLCCCWLCCCWLLRPGPAAGYWRV